MNRFFKIRIALNSLLFIGLFCLLPWHLQAEVSFSEEERRIASAIVDEFKRNCTEKLVSERNMLDRLITSEKLAKRSSQKEVDACFRDNVSQIRGVYFIYEKFCSTLIHTGVAKDNLDLARQLLNATKYQSGSRPYYGQLNDCLTIVPLQEGQSFITPYIELSLAPEVMSKAIDSIRVKDPYPTTQAPFR